MPAEWTEVPPPTRQVITQLGDRLYVVGHTIIVFTDGSWGRNTSDPRLRRCAWAWIIPGAHSPITGVCGNLLGQQTVPRSELRAILECLNDLK